ncbi:MAG: efflux RND transporter periplasmic adaptor subunit, partial [Stenotrophobium sp.]
GQVLLRLDPQTYRNAILRDDATRHQEQDSVERQLVALELRRVQFERTRKQFDAHMIPQSKFDEDRNALQLAEADLKESRDALAAGDAVLAESREQLGKTDIRSPISGRIVALPIKVGETAIPSTLALAGSQLMTIADTSSVQADLKVDEGDIGRVSLGERVDIFPAAWPDRALKGEVSAIALATTVTNRR